MTNKLLLSKQWTWGAFGIYANKMEGVRKVLCVRFQPVVLLSTFYAVNEKNNKNPKLIKINFIKIIVSYLSLIKKYM